MTPPARIYLSAGEPSGDAHAAALTAALRRTLPGVEIEATGGPALDALGVPLRHRAERLGASGVVEALRSVPAHLRVLADLTDRLRAGRCDLLIVLDYPGLHLRLAAAAARAGVPVLYYIAPQLWAWGATRAERLRRAARQVAVILPFEESFFRSHDIDATFVGHPLLDAPAPPPRSSARTALGLPAEAPVLALFPGSRRHEIARLWPVLREAAGVLRRAIPDLRVVVAASGAGGGFSDAGDALIWRGGVDVILGAADAALCKSGTTTLQAALAGLPMVITYQMHPVTYAIARRVVRVPWIGLVNLVAERGLVPELVQEQATPRALAAAVTPLLDRHGAAATRQREGLGEVRARLGGPGASRRVAAMAAQMVAA